MVSHLLTRMSTFELRDVALGRKFLSSVTPATATTRLVEIMKEEEGRHLSENAKNALIDILKENPGGAGISAVHIAREHLFAMAKNDTELAKELEEVRLAFLSEPS